MSSTKYLILLFFLVFWQCKGEHVLRNEQLLKYGKNNYDQNNIRYRKIVEIITNADIPLSHYAIDYLVKFDEIVVKDKNSNHGRTELFSIKKQKQLTDLLRQDDLTIIVKRNQSIQIRLDYRNISYNYIRICYLYPEFDINKEYKNHEIIKGQQKPTQEEKWIYIINKNWILYVP